MLINVNVEVPDGSMSSYCRQRYRDICMFPLLGSIAFGRDTRTTERRYARTQRGKEVPLLKVSSSPIMTEVTQHEAINKDKKTNLNDCTWLPCEALNHESYIKMSQAVFDKDG